MEKKDLRSLKIPQVRSLDGNVIMHLSPKSEDDLVLESSLLKGSGYFGRVFGNQLSNVDKHAETATFQLEHPATKSNTTIFLYSLNYVGDASDSGEEEAIDAAIAEVSSPSEEYDEAQRRKVRFLSNRMILLEPGNSSRLYCERASMGTAVYRPGERSDYGVGPGHYSEGCPGKHCLREIPPVHVSSLATGLALFVPKSSYDAKSSTDPQYIAYTHAIVSHKVLFALLAGHTLWVDDIDHDCMIRCLSDVLALAEIYDLFQPIVPAVMTTLRQLPGLWKSVSEHPTFFLALAVKLKDTELFLDAVRHVCGRGCFDCLAFDAHIEALEAAVEDQYPQWDVRVQLTKISACMATRAEGVKEIVLTELMSCRWVPGLGSENALFLGTSEARGRGAAAKWLVRSMYTEWITNEYLGLRGCRLGPTMCSNCCAKNSRSIYTKLLQAQRDIDGGDHRIRLFGEDAVSRLSQIFSVEPSIMRDPRPTGKESSKDHKNKNKQNEKSSTKQELEPKHESSVIETEFRAILKTIVEKIKPSMEDDVARYSEVDYFTFLWCSPGDDIIPWDMNDPWSRGETESEDAEKMEEWLEQIYEICRIE